MKSTLLAIVGAIVGGILGYLAFEFFLHRGFYGMILPGGLLGFGAAIGKVQSKWLALAFGFAALCLGLYTEWRFFPDPKGESLGHFLRHVTDRGPVTLLMIAAGGVLGFWIPYRGADEPKK
jgi:hypothetical protein